MREEGNYTFSTWIRYERIKGLPKGINVEICETSEETSEQFDIEKLRGFYFLDNKENNGPIKRNLQTLEVIESSVYSAIGKKEWDYRDVFRILAWKLGKINYQECEKVNLEGIAPIFIYQKGWSNDDVENRDYVVQLPNSNVIRGNDYVCLADKIIDLHKSYVTGRKSAKEIWMELIALAKRSEYNGLGTVYLVALLHFITNCECPIFDRFAMASLIVMEMKELGIEVKRGSVIHGCKLPDKKESGAGLLEENSIYMEYWGLLDKHFPNGKWKDRDVDRALWVYGHYFHVT